MAKIGINIATGSLQKEEIIVGIDLGTTNSLIAAILPGTTTPVVLREFDGTALMPSVIHINGETATIGDEAKKLLIADPANTIFSVKRLMGKSYNDIRGHAGFFNYKIIDDSQESLVKIQTGEVFYSPIELSSLILKELKHRAEHILKTPVKRTVITVPAYFNDAQRQATRDAGRLAGLEVLRIINEPTAASLAYGLGIDQGQEKTVVVYDLGGGTFDISVLRISNGIFEVLSTNGDTYLGGDDFDRLIMDHWISRYRFSGTDLADPGFMQSLRLSAEAAKKKSSAGEKYRETIGAYPLELDRIAFDSIAAGLVERTIEACRRAVEDAGIEITGIDEVIMVGGSTRIPLVKEKVAAFFGRPVNDALDPDEVVALGAAVQADILAGNNKSMLLLDITPLSLGIETMGGLMDVLIPRNSKIPSKISRQYTTQKDGQTGMRISVYQGERDLVQDNRKLAEFVLSGIPAMPAGLPKVDISFLVNADGILSVRARELRSGVEQVIEVKPQYGLTDAEIERMLGDSILHAKEDIQKRALVEAQTEALQLTDRTMQFIAKNSVFLTEAEIRETTVAVEKLKKLIASGSKDEIQAAMEALNGLSRPYAERLMDEAIANAMKGKNILE